MIGVWALGFRVQGSGFRDRKILRIGILQTPGIYCDKPTPKNPILTRNPEHKEFLDS